MLKGAFSLEGLSCIVTGGGTGIGRAIAEFFSDNGAAVAIASRSLEHLTPVKEGLERQGRKCLAKSVDVRDEAQVQELIHEVHRAFGRLDVLVNNAGASFVCPSVQVSANGLEAILGINLKGAFFASKAAFPIMAAQRRGKIINISSIAGIYGAPLMGPYGAAKAALINLTKTLAYEWGPSGVWVNAIAPGMVETEGAVDQMHLDPELAKKAKEKVPVRRWGKPIEVAYLSAFLASAASDYIQGETIVIDGGPQMPLDF